MSFVHTVNSIHHDVEPGATWEERVKTGWLAGPGAGDAGRPWAHVVPMRAIPAVAGPRTRPREGRSP